VTGTVRATMAIHALLVALLLLVACGGESANTTIVIGTGGAAGSASTAGSAGSGSGGEAGVVGSGDGGGAGGEAPAPYEGPPVMVMGDPGQLLVRGVEGPIADLAFGVTAPFYGDDYELRVLGVEIDGEYFGFHYGPGYESEVDGLTETLVTRWYPGKEPEGSIGRSDVMAFRVQRLDHKPDENGNLPYVNVEDVTAAWVELDEERVAEWP
jgi:hypothetical protein